jgi:hypothetical protein
VTKDVAGSGVEVPVFEETKPKYDVKAFRERIKGLQDNDGLYDVVDVEPIETTGVEVITESAEVDIDKYVRRK